MPLLQLEDIYDLSGDSARQNGAGMAADGGMPMTPFAGAQTPMNAPSTPFNPMTPGRATPGGSTPAPMTPGSNDDAWNAGVGNTPMHDSGAWEDAEEEDLAGGRGTSGETPSVSSTMDQTPAIDTPASAWSSTPGGATPGATPGDLLATPGGGGTRLDWAQNFVVVEITNESGGFLGRKGYIEPNPNPNADKTRYMVVLFDSEGQDDVVLDTDKFGITKVTPVANDNILILEGEYAGLVRTRSFVCGC